MILLTRLLAVFSLLALCSSCQNFKSQRRVDFAPFAEQTIASVSDLEANLGRRRRILTVEYTSEYDAELVEEFTLHISVLEAILEEMVDYSVLVARLSHGDQTEVEQVQALASYLDGYRDAMASGAVSQEMNLLEFDETIAEVREQSTMLDALLKAQPLINEAGRVAATTAGRMREILSDYDTEVTSAIEQDFSDVLAYRTQYEAQRSALLGALAAIYRYRLGDDAALDEVRQGKALRPEGMAAFDLDEPADLDELEASLSQRLMTIKQVADGLEPDYDHYIALQLEIDRMVDEFDAELRATWGVIFVWTRAHARMAAGVIDPAAWFDVSDTPGAIFRLAGSAI